MGCGWAKRDSAAVSADIAKWDSWPRELCIDGIFFDEVPSHTDHIGAMAGYADKARENHRMVVYNPGVPVDPGFYAAADMVVGVEQTVGVCSEMLDNWSHSHVVPTTGVILHSGTQYDIYPTLLRLKRVGIGALFVTDERGSSYNRWPDEWDKITAHVSGNGK